MLRILIVDDDWNSKDSLRTRFEIEPDFEVLGVAESGEEALPLIAANPPEVVVLDVTLPGAYSGPEVAEEIRARGWPTRVLAYSAWSTPDKVQAMLDAGASGYFVKGWGNTWTDLVEAVRTVAAGKPWFGKGLEEWITYRTQKEETEETLSSRRVEILQMVAQGKSDQEIARLLSLSVRTVESHIQFILKKMDARNRTHAVALAMERGWIKLRKG